MTKRGETWHAEVLDIFRRSSSPVTAYEILEVLREVNPKIAPPTVYRVLAALMERRLIHRLESMNAFVSCQCDHHDQPAILSICDDCGTVEESIAPEIMDRLSSITGKTGFSAQRHVIEVHGVCASCGPLQAPA
ncbi:MAG: Fur family transcriptional regulator [Pseudomonadota bacterium]